MRSESVTIPNVSNQRSTTDASRQLRRPSVQPRESRFALSARDVVHCALITPSAYASAEPRFAGESALSDRIYRLQVGKSVEIPETATDSPRRVNDAELTAIRRAVRAEPVESGVNHPAESTLADHAAANGVFGIIERILTDGFAPAEAADIMTLLGRVDGVLVEEQVIFVRRGLASADLAIRDAAVCAAENWASPALADLLDAHHEPVGWLSNYVAQVAKNIRG